MPAETMLTALRRERLAFGAILLFYLVLSLVVFNHIEEDAFIYFRLVENLAQGHGVVFNRGGEPVEAGSSLLWLLLLLPLWLVPLDMVISAKLLGLAMGCVVLWLVHRLCRFHIHDRVLRLAPVLLTAASTPFLMWSQRGLETPLFAVLVLWLALCCSDPRRFRWWPVPAVLLLPARPEGFFFLAALFPAFVFHRGEWREIGRSLLAVAVAAIVLLAGRLLYFHDLVPQPFYVKLHATEGQGLLQIHHYFVGDHLYAFGVPVLVAGWRRRFWTRQRIVLVGFVLTTAAWCVIANDYMPYVRHLVPAIPLVYVLVVGAVDVLANGALGARRAAAFGYVAVVLLATLLFSKTPGYFDFRWERPVRFHLRTLFQSPEDYVRETAAKIAYPLRPSRLDEVLGRRATLGTNYQSLVGEFLRRNYPAQSLVVYDQMGQTPFYAGPQMRFIDSLGLTDRTIGRASFERWKRTDVLLQVYDAVDSYAEALVFGKRRDDVTEAQALDYLFALDPDLILINSFLARTEPRGIPAQLGRDPRLQDGYELRYTLARLVRVYDRKGAPRHPLLDVPPGLEVLPH